MGIVSIIMPVYNVEKYLPRAIESAIQQTSPNWELILVNDGSTDNSGKICDVYKKQDSRIHVIHQENKGSGPARNTGLDKAKGEYIYFADPDDYFDSFLIEENLSIIEKNQADMLVFGFYKESVDKRNSVQQKEALPNIPRLNSKEEFRMHFRNFYFFSPYALWNKLYRKEFLDKYECRFSDQRLGQDALFNLTVFKELGNVSFNRKAYYHYVEHKGSAVNRYRLNRFELEFEIANKFEELILYWNRKNIFSDLISREYWHPIYLELSNLTLKDCNLRLDGKKHRLRSIANVPQIKETLNQFPLSKETNPFVKLLVILLRNDQFNLALKLMALRNQIAEKHRAGFSKISALLVERSTEI